MQYYANMADLVAFYYKIDEEKQIREVISEAYGDAI